MPDRRIAPCLIVSRGLAVKKTLKSREGELWEKSRSSLAVGPVDLYVCANLNRMLAVSRIPRQGVSYLIERPAFAVAGNCDRPMLNASLTLMFGKLAKLETRF